MKPAALAVALAVAGCHTHVHYEDTVAGDTRLRVREGAVRTLPATIEVSERGRLRFIEPLVCTHDLLVEQHSYRVTETRPNMATFIVGLITLSAGAVAMVVGLSDDDPAGSLATYLGGAGVIGGAPLVVGPYLGNDVDRVHTGDAEVVQGEKDQPCGGRPLAGTSALVRSGKRQIFGTVTKGEFAVSPFTFVDAFALHKVTGVELSAELYDDAGARRQMNITLDANALARGRDGFLASIGVDSTIEKLRKVPRVSATDIEVARVLADGQPAVEVTVTVTNQGPGDAFGVRGVLSSSNQQIDGRMVYVGRLAAGASTTTRAIIYMRADSGALGDAGIAVVMMDAHDTTSDVPFTARGPVINRQ